MFFNHDNNLVFLKEKINLIKIALFKSEINSELQLPNNIETGTVQLKKKQIISIHPGIVHSIRAVEKSLLLITNKAEEEDSSK